LNKKYNIELNKVKIGTTNFEFADVPMGVVHGKIFFENVESPYEFFKSHCTKFNVQLNCDEPELKSIDTGIISDLKVYLENGMELIGWGAAIIGMDDEEYEIQFSGISTEIMQTEFKHHYNQYYG
jgi:hypothetical protein